MSVVDISCLCGKVKSRVRLAGHVPVESYLCHRSQCRYNLGSLCHAALLIGKRPNVLDLLKVYVINDNLSRYFCDTCGSHMVEKSEYWKVQSGIIEGIHSEQVSYALEAIAGHQHVHEAVDGGLSLCLTDKIPGEGSMHEIETKLHCAGEGINTPQSHSPLSIHGRDRLQASCICGGVQFFITRPNQQSGQCSSPFPDLMVPYHAQSPENPRDEKWWIRDDHKWLAGTCTCRSCRLGLGSPIQAWAFVSRANIFNPDESPLAYDCGMLQSFASSTGVRREFCQRCGATIFWHSDERPGVVDVSVGVLRAPEGSLARTWLEWWTERVSFAEQAFDKEMVRHLELGLHRLKST